MNLNEACSRYQDIKVKHNRRLRYSKRQLLQQYIFQVLPRVNKLLRCWGEMAAACPDRELRRQALASLKLKDFHCQGGAVFAVYADARNKEILHLIVAYQTICDYLDNLCDRAGETSEMAFLRLHQSLLAALDVNRPHLDYYEYFPETDDGGYLLTLIEECRRCLNALPSYEMVKGHILQLVEWYIGLQVNKHLDWEKREKRLQDWVNQYLSEFPGLLWNEWAAAAGSTLALFALLRLSCQHNLEYEQVKKTWDAYFPWICALHILLDYFIDQEEDIEGRDLNFIFYYRDIEHAVERIKLCIRESRQRTSTSPSKLDDLVVEGLLAMYLSDGKVSRQGFQGLARDLIKECGGNARRVFNVCLLVRVFL